MRSSIWKKVLAGMVSAVLTLTAVPVTSAFVQQEAEAASVTLKNPRIVKEDSLQAGQKVTWDCIWFGSYPQREVIKDKTTCNISSENEKEFQEQVIEDPVLFQKLENASDWNQADEITIDNEKYRRNLSYIQETDTKLVSVWHYFKYEPIKWRVLKVEDKRALLLSDQILDINTYNLYYESSVWKTSTIREWLNAYGTAWTVPESPNHMDRNFFDSAFTPKEQESIFVTDVENENNLRDDTEAGDDTKDKIFLLSEKEVYGSEQAKAYGFTERRNENWEDICDEAKKSKISTYAKKNAIENDENNRSLRSWWLRSPGPWTQFAVCIDSNGRVGEQLVSFACRGIRPALNLDLSAADVWTYAGTTESGKVNEKPSNSASDTTKVTIKDSIKQGDIKKVEGIEYRITSTGTSNIVEYRKADFKTQKTVKIPETVKINGEIYKVTAIAKNCFKGNKKLKNVIISKNIKSIGANAFYGCKNLKTIKIISTSLTKKSVGKNVFKGIHKKAVIKVPKKKLKDYKKILKGKGQAKSVKIKK